MAIDIYEGRTRSFSISEDTFLALDDAQAELRSKAGRTIDAYATTAIEPEHALLWLSGLRRILPGPRRDARARQACDHLIALLEDVTNRRQTIIVEGE